MLLHLDTRSLEYIVTNMDGFTMTDVLTGYRSTVGNAKKFYKGGRSGAALLDLRNRRYSVAATGKPHYF